MIPSPRRDIAALIGEQRDIVDGILPGTDGGAAGHDGDGLGRPAVRLQPARRETGVADERAPPLNTPMGML